MIKNGKHIDIDAFVKMLDLPDLKMGLDVERLAADLTTEQVAILGFLLSDSQATLALSYFLRNELLRRVPQPLDAIPVIQKAADKYFRKLDENEV